MHFHRRIATSPVFALYLTGFLWSFSGILIKLIDCNAFAVAGARGAIAVLVQVLYLWCRGERYQLPRVWLGWLGAVMFTCNTILLVFAFQLTSTANAVFLHFSGMALAAFAAPRLLKERTSKRDWLAIALVLFGVSRLAGANLLDRHSGTGDLLGILCGITLAIEVICFRKIAKVEKAREVSNQNSLSPQANRSDLLHAIITSDLLTCGVSILMVMFVRSENVNISQNWWLFIVLGIVPWALPNILYCYVVKEVPSVVKAMIAWSLDPVFTVIWPMLAMSEFPSAKGYFGCAVILCAVLIGRSTEVSKTEDVSHVQVTA